MKKLLYLLLILTFGVGCGEGENGGELTLADTLEQTANLTVMELRTTREFSEPGKTDNFALLFYGDSLASSTAVFSITNSEGDTIYKDEFEARMLAGSMLLEGDTTNMGGVIRENVKKFFHPTHFTQANPEQMPLDTFIVQRPVYEEVMNDPQGRPAFFYLLGYENGITIAYSRALNKVVIIHNCC